MAQLRAKQIKLTNPGDLLIGGTQGNGTVLPAGGNGQVLKVLAGGLVYSDNDAEDIAFTPAGTIAATTVQAAIAEVATDAAAALATAEAALDGRLDVLEGQNLDTRLDAAEDDIIDLQAELDATQAGAGLGTDGAYGTNTGTNYLNAATSLKNADSLLDSAIKTVADDLAALVTDSGADLAALQTEVDAIETGVGLNADGTYTPPVGTSYVTAPNTLKGAIVALDTALSDVDAAYQVADAALDGRLDTVETNLSAAEEDILTIIQSAGLGNGGLFPVSYGNDILDSPLPVGGAPVTTLRSADIRLAQEIQIVQGELVTIVNTANTLRDDLDDEITARLAADGDLVALTDGIITGTGLGITGAYPTEAADLTNYLGSATSLFDADVALDSAIADLQDQLDTLQGGAGTTSLTSLQTEVDNLQLDLGFNPTTGRKPDFTSINFINSTSSIFEAIEFLDEAAGLFDTGIQDVNARIDALGAAFNYVGVLGGLGYEAFAGGIDGASATDLNGLGSGEKDPGDYYKVSGDGFFKVGAAGTPFFVKANDGLVWNTSGGVDVIDNTNSNVIAGTNISVTGSTDAGFTVSLAGIVPVANGGTGKAALEDVTAGSSKITLGSGATGSVVNAFSIDVVPSEILFSTLGQVGTPVDGRFLRWNGTSSTIEYVTAGQLGATVRVEEDFAPSTAVDATVALANTPIGDIQVFINGIKLKKAGYSVTGLNVTLNDVANGYGIETGDTLSVSYSRAA